jgi:hypothetical protein
MIVRHPSKLSREEKERIFTHGLHEEGIFYNRLNFFLVFESLLVAAFASSLSATGAPPTEINILVCVVGFFVSVLWWYAQVNKLVLLRVLERRSLEAFREFRESIWMANQSRRLHVRDANEILGHGLPGIFVVLWLLIGYYLWQMISAKLVFP